MGLEMLDGEFFSLSFVSVYSSALFFSFFFVTVFFSGEVSSYKAKLKRSKTSFHRNFTEIL